MEIRLTKGYWTKIDVDDFRQIALCSWSVLLSGDQAYAGTRVNGKYIYLHRMILGDPPFDKAIVDHINGDGLDNRRSNLRWASHTQNMWNSKKRIKRLSPLKGAAWCKQTQKWRARIRQNGKVFEIGRFDSETEAAEAYRAKAKELHGEFAPSVF